MEFFDLGLRCSDSGVFSMAKKLGFSGVGVLLPWEKGVFDIAKGIRGEGIAVGVELSSGIRNKARDIRKNIEIISAIREDREAVETAEVDIVFPGEMNYIMVRLAKKNQVAVGFDFHPLLHSSGKGRGRLLGDYLQTARLVRKYKAPFLLTSGAKSEWELRSPSELVAFGKVLGFSEADAKEALSGKILERNRKRLGKGWVMPGVEEK